MNSESAPQIVDLQIAYEEVGQNYRKFLDWREKIIGGYVAVIGALGVGYHQSDGHPGFQSVLLLASALASLAFWILNMRNSKFIVTCVVAGRRLERGRDGVYEEMKTLTHTSRLTHGLAVNLLVCGVIAGSVFGLWTARNSWWKDEYLCSLVLCAAAFVVLVFAAEKLGDPGPEL